MLSSTFIAYNYTAVKLAIWESCLDKFAPSIEFLLEVSFAFLIELTFFQLSTYSSLYNFKF